MKEYELEIGGQRIDKHYGHWHSVYSQLTEFNPSGSSSTLFNKIVGNGYGFNSHNTLTGEIAPSWTISGQGGTTSGRIFIPLYFWFCRNPGLALPLIALQYHEVKVKITFENQDNLIFEDDNGDYEDISSGSALPASITKNDLKLWCDYIYLDTDERRRFAQVSHEYLIEQVQFSSFSGTPNTSTTLELNFNHPVKELIWSGAIGSGVPTTIFTDSGGGNDYGSQGIIGLEGRVANQQIIKNGAFYVEQKLSGKWKLKLNGHDRFKERDTKYFTRTQVWQHHSGYGSTNNEDSIALYSFALKPEEHQPSGTCNFSRIDNAELSGTFPEDTSSERKENTGGRINVYAVNYNVLRIMSGMGGLAYSN